MQAFGLNSLVDYFNIKPMIYWRDIRREYDNTEGDITVASVYYQYENFRLQQEWSTSNSNAKMYKFGSTNSKQIAN